MADNLRQMPKAAILANAVQDELTNQVPSQMPSRLSRNSSNQISGESPSPLSGHIAKAIRAAGGWIGFDTFMALALYAPGLGYYANDSAKFGILPPSATTEGSDFVTAPEMTPLFGRALAAQVAQALAQTETDQIWEFGAGTGALARDILEELDRNKVTWRRYTIVELSASLRIRQQEKLAAFRDRVTWVDQLPPTMRGVVIGNEVLDAMPVKLLARHPGAAFGQWTERGVAVREKSSDVQQDEIAFCWQDRSTVLRPPCDIEGAQAYVTEIHQQGEAFVRTLADHLEQGVAFFIDYGFPEHEYYHAQRHMGTLMCHRAHRADGLPLDDVGLKDITAHVNFTGVALAAQEAGFDVVGYCTQARFLMNCGLLNLLEPASFADKAMVQKLISEHEMGELFKVIALEKRLTGQDRREKQIRSALDDGQTVPPGWLPLGFAQGDRTHTL